MRRPALALLALALGCSTDDDTKEGAAGDGGDDDAVDADGDGYGEGADCDDGSAAIHPGADERCDGLDNDCDGQVDEDPVDGATYFVDADGDGHGDPDRETVACEAADGLSETGDDCDDTDDGVSPSATEACDELDVDEDCDGLADDADDVVDETTLVQWFVDADGDGHGAGAERLACDDPSADGTVYSLTDDDCDDGDPAISPSATEVCDEADVDEDCDGLADDADDSVDAGTRSTWYGDGDGDGFGVAVTTVAACDDPSTEGDAWSAVDTDCDDTRADVHPDGQEVCDADDADEDCDTLSDDLDPSVDTGTFTAWYVDADGDGHGNPDGSQLACDAPTGGGRTFVADGTDCDDADADVSPRAQEVCDALDIDEDCDGLSDDDDSSVDAATTSSWYTDADGDGHGDDGATAVPACDDPSGAGGDYAATADDCDDGDAGVSPSATEVCDEDDIDEDCDGLSDDDDSSVDTATASDWYPDDDLDGYGESGAAATTACDEPTGSAAAYVADDTDCDDGDEGVNPGATEIYGDGTDQTCDGSDTPEFACSGYSVPGDYATIGAASSALGNSASVQTICLSAGTYTENPTLRGNLEIIGPSQYETTISGHVTVSNGRSGATIGIQGVTITRGVEVRDDGGTSTTTIEDCIIESSGYHGIHVDRDGYGTPHVAVRRCVIEGGSGVSAVYLYDYGYNSTDRVSLEVRDSYLSGGNYTVRTAVTKSSSRRTYQSVTIVNNTIEGGSYGLWMIGRYTPFQIKNNIITGNSTGLHWDGGGSMTNDYNLYYANASNFSGSATGGSNRISGDPGLSADVPPVPTSGGLADGAGTTSYASTVDYWTNTRPSPPSIGAVEPQ